jgi:voltage-gated potassium channel Kch
MNGQAIIHESELNEITGFVSLQGWLQLLIIVGAISLIIVGGRFIARYFFRLVAETGMHEIFTAMALLLVVGIALLMNEIGLSPAMGTFLAGVVLADNEYRHELESTIDPFKGLLLGLFFITVGASINFTLFLAEPVTIIGFTLLLITIKFVVLLMLGRMFKLRKGYDYLFAFLLAQSSEFAFVLITFSQQNLLFDSQTSGMLILVVTLSMALSPVLLIFNEKAIAPILSKMQNKMEAEWVDNATNPVIIAGFGRFGLAVGRLLLANRIKVTIIDSNPTNVEVLRKFGFKLFYGDVTRHEVLERAGVKNARLIILSMAEYDEAVKVASYLRKKYPRLKIMARAKDIYHTFEFFKENVTTVQHEVFSSAADLGEKALVYLGHTPYEAYRATRTFKHHEKQVTEDLYKAWKEDENRFIQDTRRFSEQLAEILEAEKGYGINDEEYSWDNQNNRKPPENTFDENGKPPEKQDLDFF